MTMPITSLFAALFAIMLVALSLTVGLTRVKTGVNLGDGGDDKLLTRIRTQGNFVEYVPTGLILLGLCEVGGSAAGLLWAIGGLLLVGRVSHAAGLLTATLPLRGGGMILTFLSLLIGAGTLLFGFFR